MTLRQVFTPRTRYSILLGAIVSTTPFSDACNGRGSSGSSGRAERSIDVPVTTVVAASEDVPVQVGAIGWVEAHDSVTIRPQVEGQLTEIHLIEGQDVKAGDLLFTIDPRPFVAALRLAEANLLKDQALAQDAAREARRVAELFAKDVAADRERDQTQANTDAAWAQVQADQAAIENAKLRLDYCSIRSLIDGRAGARLADRGNIVKANETPLVTINRISPIYVTFSVAERHLPVITQHMLSGPLSVDAHYADKQGSPIVGRLTFVDNQVDVQTGMVRLKATFENADYRLWPGRFVNVTLKITIQHDAVVVPSQAVQTGQQGQFLFVVGKDGTAEMRPIATGPMVEGRTVVTKGLAAGEVVVTDGQLRLTPGAKVRAKESTADQVRGES